MNVITQLIWLAGAIQVLMIAANLFLPQKLECDKNLARVSVFIREMFIVHWIYIVLIVGVFATLSFVFAHELADGNALGRFLSSTIAIFWLARIPIQLFCYDPAVRRTNRAADAGFLLAFTYLAGVFGVAALGIAS